MHRDKITQSFHCPETLVKEMDLCVHRSMQIHKQEVTRADFIKDAQYHYFDYLSEKTDDEIIETLIDEHRPYDTEENIVISFDQNKKLRDVIDELMYRVSEIAGTEDNKKRHSKSLFYLKAVYFWVERMKNFKTDKALDYVLKKKKEEEIEKRKLQYERRKKNNENS